ncbi:DUF2304 domain-containing protein [Fimbriiglobus ruber]|uniref:DUF2304 domain-containing protein n=1 Tax=Fimbriiglobus ruber TaxID=1908690 RepID=A0A225E2G2_9BACT|nr:DUF2304 domain-containing protein [Fimbriiglobus ruber]OWK44968.1 hypothetical protein FRUB_01299 [Fimbriiglobus ruber]
MTGFQVVSLAVLGVLLLRDVLGLTGLKGGLTLRAARSAVWVAAAVTIADPMLVQEVAYLLGVGRGADVILYLFVLAFLWVSFSLYAAHLRTQRQLTAVVRHLAVREATFGGSAAGGPPG